MKMRVSISSLAVLFILSISATASALSPVAENDWGLKIVIFDVGQADAALLLTPDGEAALIDMGEEKERGEMIADYLLDPDKNKIAAIDSLKLMFCSHYDGDHIGGACGLDGKIKILACYDQGPSAMRNPNSTKTLYGKYVRLVGDPNGNGKRDQGESEFVRHKAKPGDKFTMDKKVKIQILSACGDTKGKQHDLPLSPDNPNIDNENPGSLIQLVTLGDFAYLSMGDATCSDWVKAEPDTEGEMIAAHAIPQTTGVDVLKVGHHGSDTSTGLALVTNIRPKTAVISSCPTKDSLPKLTSVKALEESAQVFVTGSAHNPQGDFNNSKAPYDDGYVPKHLNESAGTITILVSKDGSKYTIDCQNNPAYNATLSAKDNK